jgi:predicted acyl esterase
LEHDLTIIGPIEIELHVSTSGTDSDWVVKLIDVYPDDFPNPEDNSREIQMGSYQQLVRGDVIRGKFRESFETPKPFVPDQPTVVRFTMPDTHHCFRSDHRLMIQVQSSWFPLVDRNPQKFCDIFKASTEDYQSAVQRLFHSSDKPSHIKVLVLP